MSTAVMISIQPEWCEKIASGEKTIEVRKTTPKIETPFKCYIYCTKGYPALWKDGKGVFKGNPRFEWLHFTPDMLNGKVIGEFMCDFVHVYPWRQNEFPFQDNGEYIISSNELKESYLTYSDFENYGFDGMDFQALFGWHISELKIYDKPLEITQFIKPCPYDEICECCGEYFEIEDCCKNAALQIRRPPQSWYYVEEGVFSA